MYTSVKNWVEPLRNLAVGVSMASLFLVPSTSYSTAQVEQKPVQSKIDLVTIIPDGNFDFRTAYIRSSQGLSFILPMSTLQVSGDIDNDNIPYMLRDVTGLPVETLASLANVSRNAYYKWLDGRGVSSEHVARLRELLDTFHTLYNLRGTDLRKFLETTGPAGKPIDLLASGDSSAVIGLAMRSTSTPIVSSSVSNVARQISGLSDWLRPVTRLNWSTPHLSESEKALDQLNPTPLDNRMDVHDNLDEDEAFVAWGFFLE